MCRPARRACTVYSNAQFVYWPIALVLAYVAIAAFYIRRSRARGIETRVRPYAIAGIIIAVALTGAALWEAAQSLGQRPDLGLQRLCTTGWPPRLLPSGSRCWCWPGRNATAPCSC